MPQAHSKEAEGVARGLQTTWMNQPICLQNEIVKRLNTSKIDRVSIEHWEPDVFQAYKELV